MIKKLLSIACSGILAMACFGFVNASAEGAIPYDNQGMDPGNHYDANVTRWSWSGFYSSPITYTVIGGASAHHVGHTVSLSNGTIRADYGNGCSAENTNRTCSIEAAGSQRKYTLTSTNSRYGSSYNVTRAYWR